MNDEKIHWYSWNENKRENRTKIFTQDFIQFEYIYLFSMLIIIILCLSSSEKQLQFFFIRFYDSLNYFRAQIQILMGEKIIMMVIMIKFPNLCTTMYRIYKNNIVKNQCVPLLLFFILL